MVLGGDHSLGIGSVHGTANATAKTCGDIGLIWIDAHPDINTPMTSSSGNLHGQSMAFILHELNEYVPELRGFEWNKSWYVFVLTIRLVLMFEKASSRMSIHVSRYIILRRSYIIVLKQTSVL